MYIKRLKLQNFKSYRGQHTFEFVPGLNCIVGENNGGKSTIFEGITYIMGIGRPDDSLVCTDPDPADTRMRVEMDIVVDPEVDFKDDKYARLRAYHFADDDDEIIRIERMPDLRTVQQGGREVQLDGKKLPIWNPDTEQFENPTGIDALLKGLVNVEPIWADTIPGEVADFGATKILGKIIDAKVKGFLDSAAWGVFKAAHKEAFVDSQGSLVSQMDAIANQISQVVQEQYGDATLRFNFNEPEASALVKSGELLVHDGVGETPLALKGTGMQRAFSLALIQVLAKVTRGTVDAGPPLILLIDEPETWLHPSAQIKLGEALGAIEDQLFLITHSPYLLRRLNPDKHQLMLISGKGTEAEVTSRKDLGIEKLGHPTLGEITYKAFGIATDEFFIELYTLLEKRLGYKLRKALFQQGLPEWKERIWPDGGKLMLPRPVYVRHSIYHPGTENVPHTEQDLRDSIEDMLGVINKLVPLTPSPDPDEDGDETA